MKHSRNNQTKLLEKFYESFCRKYKDFVTTFNVHEIFRYSQLSDNIFLTRDVVGDFWTPCRFFDEKLYHKISESSYRSIAIDFNYRETLIRFKVFGQEPMSVLTVKAKTFVIVLCFLIDFLTPQSMRELYISLVLSPFKKQVNARDGGKLSAFNVNNGFTTIDSDIQRSSICIYRKEEAMKVFIHELIHAFRKDLRVSCNTLLNEGYTETLASLLNVCLVACTKNRDYSSLLQKEMTFFVKKRNIVCQHINNIDKGLQDNVIAYYILKEYLFRNIEKFIGAFGSPGKYKKLVKEFRVDTTPYSSHVHSFVTRSLRMSSIDVFK